MICVCRPGQRTLGGRGRPCSEHCSSRGRTMSSRTRWPATRCAISSSWRLWLERTVGLGTSTPRLVGHAELPRRAAEGHATYGVALLYAISVACGLLIFAGGGPRRARAAATARDARRRTPTRARGGCALAGFGILLTATAATVYRRLPDRRVRPFAWLAGLALLRPRAGRGCSRHAGCRWRSSPTPRARRAWCTVSLWSDATRGRATLPGACDVVRCHVAGAAGRLVRCSASGDGASAAPRNGRGSCHSTWRCRTTSASTRPVMRLIPGGPLAWGAPR